jgi:hypothetical protein
LWVVAAFEELTTAIYPRRADIFGLEQIQTMFISRAISGM